MSRAPRIELQAALKPLLPRTWKIVPNARSVDSVPTTVVQIRLLEVTKLPQAPVALHQHTFRLTISAPQEKQQAAEDRLDDDLIVFLNALDEARIRWDTATKVEVGEMRRLGYDINVITTGKKKE